MCRRLAALVRGALQMEMENVRLVRRAVVIKRLGIGGTLFDELVRTGQFPAPVRLGKRAIAFVEAEVNTYIADRMAERQAAKAPSATAATD